MNTQSKFRNALLACALAATAAASAAPAFAQSNEMQVKIPFAFHSGQQRLPAGVYRVQVENSHVVLLRGNTRSGFIMTNPETSYKTTETGKVIFKRYGEQYFLSEIWPSGSTTGQRCVKTRQEKEAELALNQTANPVMRELALNQLPR